MAEKIILSAEIDVGDAAKSLSTLKQEFKELQKELDGLNPKSKEYTQTLQKLAGVKDNISDLRSEIEAFNPEKKLAAFSTVATTLTGGFQAATGAAQLFGAETKDVEKAMLKLQAAQNLAQGVQSISAFGDAFKILNNIMKANPILFIVSAVVGLIAILATLKDKIEIVGKVFNFFGDILGKVVSFVKDLGDSIGLTNFKAQEMAEKLEEAAKKLDHVIEIRSKLFDREKKLAEAAGKSTEEIEKRKQTAIIQTLQLQQKAIETQGALLGKLSDEQKQKLEEIKFRILDANTEIEAITIKQEVERKKRIEDANKKRAEERKAQIQEEAEQEAKLNELRARINKQIRDDLAADQAKADAERLASMEAQAASELAILEKKQRDAIALKQGEVALAAALDRTAFQVAASIGTLFIQNAEKQKKYQKGVAIAKIIVDTAKGISSAVAGAQAAAAAGGPAYPFLAAAYTIEGIGLVLANMAQAKSVLDQDNSTSVPTLTTAAPSVSSTPSIAATAATVAPQLNGVSNTSTILNYGPGDKVPPTKVVLVETDVTKSQKQVSKIEMTSKY